MFSRVTCRPTWRSLGSVKNLERTDASKLDRCALGVQQLGIAALGPRHPTWRARETQAAKVVAGVRLRTGCATAMLTSSALHVHPLKHDAQLCACLCVTQPERAVAGYQPLALLRSELIHGIVDGQPAHLRTSPSQVRRNLRTSRRCLGPQFAQLSGRAMLSAVERRANNPQLQRRRKVAARSRVAKDSHPRRRQNDTQRGVAYGVEPSPLPDASRYRPDAAASD